MTETEPQFLNVGDGVHRRRIAYIIAPPTEPGGVNIIWLLGLKSDMVSTKATALADWAPQNRFGLTRFEYSGHGSSEGEFDKATIGDWLEETRAVFQNLTAGPQILVGSSTGGHIALLLLRDVLRNDPQAVQRIKGLVLIAPAWDLTEALMWNRYSDEIKTELMEKGVYHQPSEYGEPFVITRRFIEEGRNHLFNREPFDPGRPVIILQGQLDDAVPAQHSRDLAAFLTGGWAELIEVSDGEHRMSRPQDLDLLFDAIKRVAR